MSGKRSKRRDKLDAMDLGVLPFDERFYEMAVGWLMDLHALDPNRVSMNGQQRSAARRYLDHVIADPANTLFLIFADGEAVGLIGMLASDRTLRSCELVIAIDKAARGKGIGRKVGVQFIAGLFDAGFEDLQVKCRSKDSVNLCQRIGFKEMGLVPMQLRRRDW